MKTILIELDENHRQRTTVDGTDVTFAYNCDGYIMIDSERESTILEVHYPVEYAGMTARAYIKNADRNQTHVDIAEDIPEDGICRYYLPEEAAVGGVTTIVHAAETASQKTHWQAVVIPIAPTGVNVHRALFPTKEEYDDILQNETLRKEAEVKREAAEAQRAASETVRESNEAARENAEAARRFAENVRQSNEAQRTKAEQVRYENELTRQTNEAARESYVSGLKDELEAAFRTKTGIRIGSADEVEEEIVLPGESTDEKLTIYLKCGGAT